MPQDTNRKEFLTIEKNSRAWFIVATFFQLNSLIKAILAGFNFWSGPMRR